MVIVKTLISVGGELRNLEGNISGAIDKDYVEGAVQLIIDGTEIIAVDMLDYIDQLWSYFVEGCESLVKNEPFEVYFPDQPILIVLEPVKVGLVKMAVTPNGKPRRSAVTERGGFIAEVMNEAERVFTRLSQLIPENAAAYDEVRKRAQVLGARVQKSR